MDTQKNASDIAFYYQPKLTTNYLVNFPKENIPNFIFQNISMPKYVNGKWDDIIIDIIDLYGPSTSAILYSLVTGNKIGSTQLDQRSFFEKLFRKPIFTFEIQILDPTKHIFEVWKIDVKKIVSVDFGNKSYSNMNELSKIKMVVRPSKCLFYFPWENED